MVEISETHEEKRVLGEFNMHRTFKARGEP